MGIARKMILIGLGLVMAMGVAVYLRLWTIDYRVTSDEVLLLRRQFDLASKEAMDESAQWRLMYDEEVKRSNECVKELAEVRESLKKVVVTSNSHEKLEMLQKGNISLIERIESLNQELEAEKLKCRTQWHQRK